MADRRTARGSRLLDPVWHWLNDAEDRIYRELEPGAQPVSMSVMVKQAGEEVSYTVLPGERTVRRILVDGDTLIDITPPDTAEEAAGG